MSYDKSKKTVFSRKAAEIAKNVKSELWFINVCMFSPQFLSFAALRDYIFTKSPPVGR